MNDPWFTDENTRTVVLNGVMRQGFAFISPEGDPDSGYGNSIVVSVKGRLPDGVEYAVEVPGLFEGSREAKRIEWHQTTPLDSGMSKLVI